MLVYWTLKSLSRPRVTLARSYCNSQRCVRAFVSVGLLCYTLGMQEMRLVFPNSHRINRGNYVVKELADACRANDVTDLVILHEHRGVPGAS